MPIQSLDAMHLISDLDANHGHGRHDAKHWDEVDARVRAPAIFDLDANHGHGRHDANVSVSLMSVLVANSVCKASQT